MVCNLVTYRARSAVREVGLCAGVPAAAGGSRGQGARDVRLRDGPARPRGRRRLRRVLPPPGRGRCRRRPAPPMPRPRSASSTGWASSTRACRSSARSRPGASPQARGPDAPAAPRPVRAGSRMRTAAPTERGRANDQIDTQGRLDARQVLAAFRLHGLRAEIRPGRERGTGTNAGAAPALGAAASRRIDALVDPGVDLAKKVGLASSESETRHGAAERRGRAEPVGDVGGGAGVAAGDPAGRARGRRGRAGRHAGERRLAAGRARAPATAPTSRGRPVRAGARCDGRPIDPESGMPVRCRRDARIDRTDRLGQAEPLGHEGKQRDRPAPTDGNIRGGIGVDRVGRADPIERRTQLGGENRAGAGAAGEGRQHGRHVRLGALARVLRPDRRLPPPPVDPLGRDARDRRAAHRHRAAGAGDDAGPRRRPVRQARRRGAEADQARPARARDARRDRRDRSS